MYFYAHVLIDIDTIASYDGYNPKLPNRYRLNTDLLTLILIVIWMIYFGKA